MLDEKLKKQLNGIMQLKHSLRAERLGELRMIGGRTEQMLYECKPMRLVGRNRSHLAVTGGIFIRVPVIWTTPLYVQAVPVSAEEVFANVLMLDTHIAKRC